MRNALRRVALPFLVLLVAIAVGIGGTLTAAVALAATVMIVPGTSTPHPENVAHFIDNARTYYLGDTDCGITAACNVEPVPYPASLWPLVNTTKKGSPGSFDTYGVSVAKGVKQLNSQVTAQLQDPNSGTIVVYGFSQGSNVISNELYKLAGLQTGKDRLQVVLTGNTNRPSGGIWTRLGPLGYIPILNIPLGKPTPNNIGIATTDIAYEYDPVGDAPLYPLNLLATVNAVLGLVFIHTSYLAPNGGTSADRLPDGYTAGQLADELDPTQHPENFRQYGDTTYITIPTKTLPIVQPALLLAKMTGTTPIVKPFVDLVSPVLRVLIDTGYDRSINPGVYTPFRLVPLINPWTLAGDLVNAGAEGVRAFAEDLHLGPVSPPQHSTTLVNSPAQTISPAVERTVVKPPSSSATTILAKAHRSNVATSKPSAAAQSKTGPATQNRHPSGTTGHSKKVSANAA
jgi:PE-PPE domain